MTICYPIENKLYINLTNRCNNDCTFCIRNGADGVSGYHLFLESEPTADMVAEDLRRFDLTQYVEIVFCGLGEPTLAMDVMLPAAQYIRSVSTLPIRLNTNGLANLYYSEDVTPKLRRMHRQPFRSASTRKTRSNITSSAIRITARLPLTG